MPSALIVGAGVVGLATAWELTGRGFDVTLVDSGPVPNPVASSYDHHRLIRSFYPGEPVYTRRIRDAYAAWDRLWRACGETLYVETGVIAASRRPGDWTERARDILDAVGEDYTRLTPDEAARAFPVFEFGATDYVLHTESGGALLAGRILGAYVRLLRQAGASFIGHTPVTAVDPERRLVTTADGRRLGADVVVVAPGVGAPALFEGHVDTKLVPTRSVLLYAEPPARLADAWATTPAWSDFGDPDLEVWGIPAVAGLPIKFGLGGCDPDGDPEMTRRWSDENIAEIWAAYRPLVKDFDDYRLVTGHANFWTLAPEERFVFRRIGDVCFVSACSGHGFKFGALTGADVAACIAGERTAAATEALLAGREG
ncbi:NAD(P)/FAD-dependent oxidoreductase [Methylobrevis albus]|uniref:FAD-dependent oxidoreductase n=1 Tax=Methylobrevis albus TaxID=2793297 RepID=A0A931I307_9HYPH|nr:FAD-dependent oxidoreductase [Methylobrevis albus]MBH0238519.1 FAD-dependent oxidoreductase [Methylobrevis albus]